MYEEALKQKEFLRNLTSVPDIITMVQKIIDSEPKQAASKIGWLMLQYAIVHSNDAADRERILTERRIFNMPRQQLIDMYDLVQSVKNKES